MSEIKKNNIEKLNQNIKIDKEKLLKELSIDIADKFQINGEKISILIRKNLELLKNNLNSSESLNNLKTEITESFDNISKDDTDKLFLTIKGALELIENSSKIEISTLKKDIEKTIDIDNFKNPINKYLPNILIQKAKNPQKIHEHILGFTLGTTNSAYTTVEYLYKIGIGIAKTPYHLYMIISGKGKIDSFKKM